MGRKKPTPLRRRGPVRPERRIIALFCEGAATEPEYFRALAQLPEVRRATSVDLRIDLAGAVPLTLVQQAVAAKSANTADEYWCVFDVEWPEQHPNLAQAIALAEREDIPIALSNPAFELWLLLHHVDHRAHLDTHGAVRERRRADGSVDKHLDATLYLPRRSVAADRARALRLRHLQDGTTSPHDNPSSSVDLLVEAIERSST